MKRELFFVEVGVLLDPEHEEWPYYNIKGFYDGQLSFYDEDRCAYKTYKEAIEYAYSYILEGVEKTYAIIHSYAVDVEDDEIEYMDIDNPEKECVLYFAYKKDGKIITEINKGEQ